MDNKDHTVDELSALFDEIEVGKNLDVEKSSDYGTASTGNLRPFADRCEDVKAVMKTVMEPEPVTDDAPETETETETETPDDKSTPVEAQPTPEPDKESDLETKPEPAKDDAFTETINESIRDAVGNGDYVRADDLIDIRSAKRKENKMNDNPLELSEEDLSAYHKIQEKYPGKFVLYDGGQAFKAFYRFKIRALKSILTSYPVLNVRDMDKEILGIRTKYQGTDLPDPITIGTKMSECQLARGRVTTLLMQAQMQLPAWKKCFEWANSKLWKDHELKGAHNREGLSSEHMWDIQRYYTDLQGFVDSANLLDSFLKATHDSLSRQLTCVIIRDKAGVAHETVHQELSNEVGSHPVQAQPNSDLDGLDTIESGTVIPKVRKGGLVQKDFAGAAIEEEFEDIG